MLRPLANDGPVGMCDPRQLALRERFIGAETRSTMHEFEPTSPFVADALACCCGLLIKVEMHEPSIKESRSLHAFYTAKVTTSNLVASCNVLALHHR